LWLRCGEEECAAP